MNLEIMRKLIQDMFNANHYPAPEEVLGLVVDMYDAGWADSKEHTAATRTEMGLHDILSSNDVDAKEFPAGHMLLTLEIPGQDSQKVLLTVDEVEQLEDKLSQLEHLLMKKRIEIEERQ